MQKPSTVLMVVLLASLLIITQLVMAAPPEPIPQPQASPTPLSPMMQEIKAAMTASEAAVIALQEELKSAPDEIQALQILRAVSQQKQDTEIAILRIQERYARQAGDQDTADKINLAVQKILNPDPVTPTPEAMAEREARRAGGAGNE